jgi:hypothetical protein
LGICAYGWALDSSSAAAKGSMTSAAGNFNVVWDASIRFRYESRNNLDLDDSNGSDNTSFTLQRARLGALITNAENENISAYFQLQDSRIWGSESDTTSNESNVDLHQGFAEVKAVAGSSWDWRFGRQELSYGDERQIGSVDWSNFGRAFDGIRFRHNGTRSNWDLFLTKLVEKLADDNDVDFSGIYGTGKYGAKGTWDGYLLYEQDNDSDWQLWTYGFLYKHGNREDPGWHWSLEAAMQSGDLGTDNAKGWAYAFDGRYLWDNQAKTYFRLVWAAASGDDNPTDNDVDTYIQLFPTNHNKYGFMDLVGWQNIQDIHLEFGGGMSQNSSWAIAFHSFKLMEERDGWYDANGNLVSIDPTGTSGKTIGSEWDLTFKHQYQGDNWLYWGVSQFMPGTFAENTVGSDNQTWFFVQTKIAFK